MFKRIAIIGLGLIGGSIGLALRQTKVACEIAGYDMSEETRRRAYEVGAVDQLCNSLIDAVQEADLVVLATPVGAMQQLLKDIGAFVSPATVVTDVASTKAQIVSWAEEYLPVSVPFIGGHPMAGKELSGVEVADASLFQNCIYCLTPTQNTQSVALHKVAAFVEMLNAHIWYLKPEEHDQQVASVSHLPFIASAALMNTVAQDAQWSEAGLLAASGFRDMSRLAGGSPEMYRDICLTNGTALVAQLDAYIASLQMLRENIQFQDKLVLEKIFSEAQHERLRWLASRDLSDLQIHNNGLDK